MRWLGERYAAFMPRWCIVFGFVTLTAIALSAAGDVSASPADDAGPGTCTWHPVPPTVVDVSGLKRVTASIEQGACNVRGIPSADTTVCLRIQDDGTAGDCASMTYTTAPRVYYRYVPGATYVMTGRGCFSRFEAPNLVCQPFGPLYYTL